MSESINFTIERMIFPEISFFYNPELKFSIIDHKELEIDPEFFLKGDIYRHDPKTLFVTFSLSINLKTKEYPDYAKMHVAIIGKFITENTFTEEITKKMQANFYAIIFPFLREAVFSLASRNNIELYLPITNIFDMTQKRPEIFTITGFE